MQQKKDMRLGTWNIRSLHRIGSIKTVASEMAKYNLDLVAVQEVRWIREVVSQKMNIHFSVEMGVLIIT
jgi:exonuclease III